MPLKTQTKSLGVLFERPLGSKMEKSILSSLSRDTVVAKLASRSGGPDSYASSWKAHLVEQLIANPRNHLNLLSLLFNFSNDLTPSITLWTEPKLKECSKILLDLFQTSTYACEWIMSLVEDEIYQTKIGVSRYKNTYDGYSHSEMATKSLTKPQPEIRQIIRAETMEANLLFRSNSLLTEVLESYMRRVGQVYLEETLGKILRDINRVDLDCEVNPDRLGPSSDISGAWENLSIWTNTIWTAIVNSVGSCPPELRAIFQHIKSCAEDRYGQFVPLVTYRSVSSFVFLRFLIPAILDPRLYGLLNGMYLKATQPHCVANRCPRKDNPHSQTRRTLTIIAKSIQSLANISSFKVKEPWMEPMHQFLKASKPEMKSFLDDISSPPLDCSGHCPTVTIATLSQVVSIPKHQGTELETNLQRLADQAPKSANLVIFWLTFCSPSFTTDGNTNQALRDFHEFCLCLHRQYVIHQIQKKSSEHTTRETHPPSQDDFRPWKTQSPTRKVAEAPVQSHLIMSTSSATPCKIQKNCYAPAPQLKFPSGSNGFAGFCKGAFELQAEISHKAFVIVYRPIGVYGMIRCWSCRECGFGGPCINTDTTFSGSRLKTVNNFGTRVHVSKEGIRYRWDFLAKSHVSIKPLKPEIKDYNIGTFGCIFCFAEGEMKRWRAGGDEQTAAPKFRGLESFMKHLRFHRSSTGTPSREMQHWTKCVVGRVASTEELFDINLLPF